MGEMGSAYEILVSNLKGRDHSRDVGADGMIILKWLVEK
jgi:hypothetical protein